MTSEGQFLWAVGGSTNDDRYATDDVTVYSVSEDRWYSSAKGELARMPHAVRAAGWTLQDGRIFCFGGKAANEPNSVAHVQVYDIVADEWTVRDPMPEPRSKLGKFYPVVENRYVYLFGGDTEEGRFDRVAWNWRYDIEKDAWDRGVADAPYAQSFPLPSYHDGWLYYSTGNTQQKGGQNNYPGALNQRYNPRTDQWQVVTPCPHPVTDGEGAEFDGELHFLGGWNTNTEFYHEDADHYSGPVGRLHVIYDYDANSWRYEEPLPGHWHHGGARAAAGSLWRYLGDIDEEDDRRASDRIFRWDGEQWTEMTPAPVAKWNFGTIHTRIEPRPA